MLFRSFWTRKIPNRGDGNRRKTDWEEITPEDSISREVKRPPKFEEVFIEPETPLVAPLKKGGGGSTSANCSCNG